MILHMFTVLDTKVGAYSSPFYSRSKGEALRSFSDTVKSPEHLFAKHPEDYVLFELGSFDDSNCKFDLLPAPVSLGVAIDFVQPVADIREQFNSAKRER